MPTLAVEALEPRDCPSSGDWPMSGFDPTGSRNNTGEHTLSAANIGRLGVAWTFPTAAAVTGTPAVVDGVVYAGDFAGNFYAVNANTGRLVWQKKIGAPVSDSPLVTDGVVVFGDLAGNVWGLNANTGATLWTVHPARPGIARSQIFGSPTLVGDNVVIGAASGEESGEPAGYQYTADGSVVMLDPQTGHIIWQTYTISDDAYARGWRGASVWDTPTFDKSSDTIYVATGNYFQSGTGADPGVEDGVIALNADTGAVVWKNQLVHGDIWNGNIVPGPDNPDADIADSPKLFRLADGTKVVGAGSKDGFYFVMNAATGAPVNGPDGLQLEVGGVLGGLYATGAVDQKDGVIFANGLNWPNLMVPGTDQSPVGGDLYAVSLDGRSVKWDFKTPAPDGSGVAIANGVVYFESLDGNLYALDAKAPNAAHALLAKIPTGGNFSGPAVADGRVFLGTGAIIPTASIAQYHNGIMALGLPPRAVRDVRQDAAALGGALASAGLSTAAGSPNRGQLNQSANAVARTLDAVVGDLAEIVGVDAPSTGAARNDLRAYYNAVAGDDFVAAAGALANVKADLGALFAALATPAVDQDRLAGDRAALFTALDAVLADAGAHDLTASARDAAAAFAALEVVFDDLLAGRYDLTL
jgi:outer membrane protein assembly factor BamB